LATAEYVLGILAFLERTAVETGQFGCVEGAAKDFKLAAYP